MPEIKFSHAINQALAEEMDRDPTIFLAGEDVEAGGVFGISRGLVERFGKDRVRNTPISESAIIGLAIGAAITGLRPVVEIMFFDFICCCMDQIVNQAAKMRYMFGGNISCPIVIRTQAGGGFSAGPQHSQCLESWFMHVPGLKVVVPSTPYDAKGLLITAIRDDNPVLFIEHKLLYGQKGEVPEASYTIPFGVADCKREGRDVTVVATMAMVKKAMEAAEELKIEGIDVEVIDPRTLIPLDEEGIIRSVKKTHRLVIVQEAVKFGGSGAEIAAMVVEHAFDYLDAPIIRVGAPFSPVPFSPELENRYIPSKERIISAIKEVLL
jgi:pyruvate dehydrogenase E1 component beta subunit